MYRNECVHTLLLTPHRRMQVHGQDPNSVFITDAIICQILVRVYVSLLQFCLSQNGLMDKNKVNSALLWVIPQ